MSQLRVQPDGSRAVCYPAPEKGCLVVVDRQTHGVEFLADLVAELNIPLLRGDGSEVVAAAEVAAQVVSDMGVDVGLVLGLALQNQFVDLFAGHTGLGNCLGNVDGELEAEAALMVELAGLGAGAAGDAVAENCGGHCGSSGFPEEVFVADTVGHLPATTSQRLAVGVLGNGSVLMVGAPQGVLRGVAEVHGVCGPGAVQGHVEAQLLDDPFGRTGNCGVGGATGETAGVGGHDRIEGHSVHMVLQGAGEVLEFHLVEGQGQAAAEVALAHAPAGIHDALDGGEVDAADTTISEAGTANLAAHVLDLGDGPHFGEHFPGGAWHDGLAVDFGEVALEMAHVHFGNLGIAQGDGVVDVLGHGAEDTAEHADGIVDVVVVFEATMFGGHAILAGTYCPGVVAVGNSVFDFLAGEVHDAAGVDAKNANFHNHINGGLPQTIQHVVVGRNLMLGIVDDFPALGDFLQLGPVDLLVKVVFKANGASVGTGPVVYEFAAIADQHIGFLPM